MTVRVEHIGAITKIILDRPERRNAIDRATAETLADAFRAFDALESASVAVLVGAGGHFCSGVDLKAVSSGDGQNRIHPSGDSPLGPGRMVLKKPVIAAIEGFAVAGGLEIAAWCDLRVAAETAQLGILSRRWGVPILDGGTVYLPRLIGHSRAMDLILTGRLLKADEAEQWGLVNRVVPEGQAEAVALELAAQLANFPQTCLRGDRLSVIQQWSLTLEEAMLNEFKNGLPALEKEAVAGAKRFMSGEGRGGAVKTPPQNVDES